MRYLLAIVVVIGLLAVAGSIMVGMRSFDGVVTDHSYEKGLMWDEMQKKRERLGWRVIINNRDIHRGVNEIGFRIVDRNGQEIHGDRVTLRISRPSTSAYDTDVAVSRSDAGGYAAKAVFPLHGYWDLIFSITSGDEELEIKDTIYVTKEG